MDGEVQQHSVTHFASNRAYAIELLIGEPLSPCIPVLAQRMRRAAENLDGCNMIPQQPGQTRASPSKPAVMPAPICDPTVHTSCLHTPRLCLPKMRLSSHAQQTGRLQNMSFDWRAGAQG